jgi:hypothetical protein
LEAFLAYRARSGISSSGTSTGRQREGRPLVWEDGRRIVFQTAVVVFEIDRALELGGSTRP